ncbi:MAG TPA: HEAT repeat domain-containing protein [Polyangia bacterium]|nr:HEAT repeat domain-containing protein [Polyangia bacterium]
MSRPHTTWIAAGSLLVIAGVGSLALRHHGHAPRATDEADGAAFQGFSTRPFSNSPAPPPPPETPQQVAQDVEASMMRWRVAILNKDAQAVIGLDMDFKQRPDRYREALEKSAASDENERVRAFSTRVLGKMKNPEEAPLLKRLLADTSPYVRQNAAWALGELRGAGAVAVAELRRARARDVAPEVRSAAKDALGKVE